MRKIDYSGYGSARAKLFQSVTVSCKSFFSHSTVSVFTMMESQYGNSQICLIIFDFTDLKNDF